MNPSYIVQPPSVTARLFDADGITGITLNNGVPSALQISGTFVLALSFTPTATTCQFGLSSGVVASAGLTLAAKKLVGAALNTAQPFFIRCFARRKGGASGSIAAQTIILKDSGDAVELGRFQVEAAAAGAAPRSGWLALPILSDSRWTLGDDDNIIVKTTAVDPDLEIVFEAVGTAAVV